MGSIPTPPITGTSRWQIGFGRDGRPASGRTRFSSHHQLTIPLGPFEAAELEVGDRLRVEAVGKGRVEITRIEEYLEVHRDQLNLAEAKDV